MKRVTIILFIMLFTAAVFGLDPRLTKNTCQGAKTCQHISAKINSVDKAKCLAIKKQAELKKCKDTSKSIFSGLFSFEMPKLPLEDFFLAAQKALAEKLF